MNLVTQAIKDLKAGKMIIVTDHPDREDEGDLIVAAEFATPEVVNFMAKEARGLICAPITLERAQDLNLNPMIQKNSEGMETAFTESIDGLSSTTGISAFERSQTLKDLSNESLKASSFKKPGHIFPLIAREGGVLVRPGHTEASIDLMRLSNLKPIAVICEIMAQDGSMLRGKDLKDFAQKHQLTQLSIAELIEYRKKQENLIAETVVTSLPSRYGDFIVKAYRHQITNEEHLAIYPKNFTPKANAIVRIHSECLTGDALGSLRCDCGDQLHIALNELNENPNSVLLYLRQEGRGIGLFNKMKAYKLQEQGLDTAQANEHLGFDVDLRDYAFAANILKDLGIRELVLLTNNPEKVSGLERFGITVNKQIPIQVKSNQANHAYLKTKKEKLGHHLNESF